MKKIVLSYTKNNYEFKKKSAKVRYEETLIVLYSSRENFSMHSTLVDCLIKNKDFS